MHLAQLLPHASGVTTCVSRNSVARQRAKGKTALRVTLAFTISCKFLSWPR